MPAADTVTDGEPRNVEELKHALIAAQESAAVQILLEACLPLTQQVTGVSGQLAAASGQCHQDPLCQASKFVKIHGSKLLLRSLRAGSKIIFCGRKF